MHSEKDGTRQRRMEHNS